MKRSFVIVLLSLVPASHVLAAPESPARQERIRVEIPLGGNFDPAEEEGVFVAAGHGLNVVASRDDGKTWQRVFYGAPCGDHGRWAVWNSVAYAKGVFAIAAGWGAPGTIIASDDAVHWHHLTNGNRTPPKKEGRPYDMRTTMELIGVDGAFVMPFEATPDFGRTWHATSPYRMTDEAGNRVKVNAGHPSLAHTKGRVIVVGDEGPAMFSDDLGKTWRPLQVEVPWNEERGAKGIIAKDGVFLIVKGSGETVLRSIDRGITWKPPSARREAARRTFVRSFDRRGRLLGHGRDLESQPGRHHVARPAAVDAQRTDRCLRHGNPDQRQSQAELHSS